MTDAKEKRAKPNIPVREPHKRTKIGIFDNLRKLPHPVEEFLGHVPALPRDKDAQAQISRPNTEGLSEFTGPSESEGPVNSESLSTPTSLPNTESHVKTASLANTEGPVKLTSLPDIKAPIESTGPVKSTSPVENKAKAHQFARPADFTGPVEIGEATGEQSPADLAELSFTRRPDFSLLNSLPDVAGW